MANQRRQLLRLGALLLLVATGLGLLTAVPLDPPAKWMAAHLSTLLFGILVLAEGLVWQDLRLSEGQRRAAFTMVVVSSWAGVALNVLSAILVIPGPATDIGAQPAGLQTPVLVILLIVIVPTAIGSFALLWYGLRGEASA